MFTESLTRLVVLPQKGGVTQCPNSADNNSYFQDNVSLFTSEGTFDQS